MNVVRRRGKNLRNLQIWEIKKLLQDLMDGIGDARRRKESADSQIAHNFDRIRYLRAELRRRDRN